MTSFKSVRYAVAVAAATASLAATASAQAPTIAKSTKVGAGVYEIVAHDGLVYAASVGNRGTPKPEITVLDGKTLQVKQVHTLTSAPYGLGINTKTGTLYATDTRAGAVIVMDAKSGRELGLIKNPADTAPAHLREVVVDEANNRIYASVYGKEGHVWVIDGKTNTFSHALQNVGSGATGIALDSDGKFLYTANMGGNDLSVIDLAARKVVRTIPAGGERPTNVAFDAKGHRLFVANQGTGDLTVIDAKTGSLIKSVKTGAGALGVTFNPRTNRVFVANRGAGTVSVVDGASYAVIAELPSGSHPNTVAIDRTTDQVYVTNKAKSAGRGAPPVDDPNGDTVTHITVTPVRP